MVFQGLAGLIKNAGEKTGKEDPSNDDVDQLVAMQLNQMSMQERELVFYDLHGISENSKENEPGFLAERLAAVQEVLDRMPFRQRRSYDRALILNPHYVTNRGFRLKFLRADDYDPGNAALRITRHFETKMELFGKELLCKDITQDDLDDETLKCLYSGWVQDLLIRDRAGRVVNICFPSLKDMSGTTQHYYF